MSSPALWGHHTAYVGAALAVVVAGIAAELALLAAARRRLDRSNDAAPGSRP